MVVKQGGGERQASTHVLEGIVANETEPLKGEPSHRRLFTLRVGKSVYTLGGLVLLPHRASDGPQDVALSRVASENHVLAAGLSQPDQSNRGHDQREQSDGGQDGHGDREFFVGEVGHGAASYYLGMRPEEVSELLSGVQDGRTTVDDALTVLRRLPSTEDLGFALLDTHRELRQGLPEAIFAEGKEPSEVVAIADRMLRTTTSAVVATRCPDETAHALVSEFPDARLHGRARLVVLRESDRNAGRLGTVSVVSAGTSDIPVADEAAATAAALAIDVERITDVGVAGLHRILDVQDALHDTDVVIVVAGMEGALASLVGGISSAPVIAVPTSVGYGASFEGLAALLAMLNSCAAGLVVTNIDNGFGAACCAARMLLKQAERARGERHESEGDADPS